MSLAGKGIAELTKLSNDLEKAQSKQLSFWQTLEDAFAKGGGNDELGGPVDDDRGTNAAARADKIQQKQALLNKGVDELTAKEKEAEESADKLTDALTNQAPSVALSSYNKQLEEARQKLAAINPNSLAGQVAWEAQSKEVVRLVGDVKQLRDIQGKADTESADFSIKQRQAAIEEARARGENVDAAQHQLSVEQKIGELTKTKAEALRDGTVTQAQINSLAEREVTNAERLKAAHAGTHSEASGLRLEHQQIEALLAQENQQISKIKSDLQAIDSNPFLTINEKDAANAQLIPQAIEKLNQQITQNKAVIANSALDPRLWTQAQGNIQKATTEIGQWQIKLQLANNPMKQLQASLTSWVNSFGRTANQIGSAITNTIGTAVSGVSNAITGAIFKTQSWGQAFAQTAQQIVGNLVNIVPAVGGATARHAGPSRDFRADRSGHDRFRCSRVGRGVGAGRNRRVDRYRRGSGSRGNNGARGGNGGGSRHCDRLQLGGRRWIRGGRFHRRAGRPVRRLRARRGIRLQRAGRSPRWRGKSRKSTRQSDSTELRSGRLRRSFARHRHRSQRPRRRRFARMDRGARRERSGRANVRLACGP